MRSSSGKLRNRILAFLFSVILAGSFVLWGVGDIIVAPRDRIVAEVNGEPITLPRFSQAFNTLLRAYNQDQQTAIDIRQARALGLDRQVLERIIQEQILDVRAQERGLFVSPQQAARHLQQYPAFEDAFGNFDPLAWRYFLGRQGLSEADFLSRQQNFEERRQLLSPAEAKIPPPALLIKNLFQYENQERTATYLVVAPPPLTTTPSTEELRAFYTTYKNLFARPETRFISLLSLEADAILKTISIPQEQLLRAYKEQKSSLYQEERRQIEQIVFADAQSAHKAYERIQTGTSLASIARERGLSESDTHIGNLSRAEMPSLQVEEVVFALSSGEVTKPIKTPFGFVLARVDKITPAHTPTFEEARKELLDVLAQDLLYDAVDSLYTRIEDALAAGDSLVQIAKNLDLSLVQNIPLTKNYIPATPPALSQIPDLYNVALEAQEEVLPVETLQGDFYWIALDSLQKKTVPPLEEIREDVLDLWKKNARKELLAKETQSLTTLAALQTFAEDRKKSLLTTPSLRRDHRDKIFSEEAMIALFSAKKDTCRSAPVSVGDSWVVLCVLKIISPKPTAATLLSLQEELESVLQEELVSQYLGAISEGAEIRTYDSILQAYFGGAYDSTSY